MSHSNRKQVFAELLRNGVFLVCLLLSSVTLSQEIDTSEDTTPQQDTLRKGFLDPEQKKQMALAATLQEKEIVWLDVLYPEMESPRKVLAIAKPSLIAEKQGAILLLHDKEQHADWPQIIRPLRETLPKWGWFTLSVNLPDELRLQQPEREFAAKEYDQISLNETIKKSLTSGMRVRSEQHAVDSNALADTDSQAEESSADENTTEDESVDINLAVASQEVKPDIPYQIRALSHIEKAMDYLRNQSYQNIVLLASRQSAELVFDYIKKHQADITSPGFTLIMIGPDLPASYIEDVSVWLGADFKPPVLDIIDSGDSRAEAQAELRKLAFERAGAQAYRQIFMPVSNSYQFHESLIKRIRLWLDKAAPGMSMQ